MRKISKLFYLFLVVATGLGVTACGGGGGSVTQPPALVTYSDKVGLGQVQNYMDADWLFQNYLGSYGLPSEVKPVMMPAIQMLANGFALQFKRGDDVTSNIAHFHEQFTMFAASGQMAQFAQSMSEPPPVLPAPVALPPMTEEAMKEAKMRVEAEMTEEAKKAVAESLAYHAALRAEVLSIAKQYELPYTISGRDEQWFIYTPAMKGGGKGRGSAPAPAPGVRQHPDLRNWNWRMGDVIWSNGESGTGIPGHVGLVSKGYGFPEIIDANTPGVRRHNDMNFWGNKYTRVSAHNPFQLDWNWQIYDCLLNYGNGAWWCGLGNTFMRKSAVDYAKLQVGKPYNWNFTNPLDTRRFYCSSLVWVAYLLSGYNLTPNRVPGIVLPSDVTVNSPVMTTFNSSSI